MSIRDQKRAVILLSGGLDSTTVLAMARRDGFTCDALSFVYGQRHEHEVRAAEAVAEHYDTPLQVVRIDLSAFGGSALTDHTIDVPKARSADDMSEGVPVTYVPARNTIFLSYALAKAEVTGALDIFIGANAVDYSGYPDCRPAFIEAFEALANKATRVVDDPHATMRVRAPLLHMTKAEIIQAGTALGVDYAQTTSCYDPDAEARACGECDACILRAQGFSDAGVADPTRYTPR